MCKQYLHRSHPPTPSAHNLSPPTGTNPSDKICSALLLLPYMNLTPNFYHELPLPFLHRVML
jgi:hypothetical protein